MSRWVLVVLVLLAPAARAEVVVRIAQEGIDVTATAAPLADVLDGLAKQTGMEIVYDGEPPRQKVSVALQGRSAAEAVQGILEGQGLNYVLVGDSTGLHVKTLILAGEAGKGSSAGSSSRGPSPLARRPPLPPGAGADLMDPGFDELEDEELYDDSDLMDEELLEDEPDEEGPLAPEAAIAPPGSGALPFPGGQPQIYPASPFAPQPFSPQGGEETP
jgi:hypothetical protein